MNAAVNAAVDVDDASPHLTGAHSQFLHMALVGSRAQVEMTNPNDAGPRMMPHPNPRLLLC